MTPWAEQQWGVPTAIWIGTLSCVASLVAAILLVCIIDDPPATDLCVEAEELDTTPLLTYTPGTEHGDGDSQYHEPSFSSTTTAAAIEPDDYRRPTTSTCAQPLQRQSSILLHIPSMLRREASFADSVHSVRFSPGLAKSGRRPSLYILTDQKQPSQQRSCSKMRWWLDQWWNDLKLFPSSFWLICTLVVLLYGTVTPFNSIASDFLQSKWYHGRPRKAAAVMGIPDTLSAVLVPVFGMAVDRFGRRASTLIGSAFIIVVAHSMLGFTMLNPIIAFSLLGISYATFGVALWPSIAW